MIHLLNSALNNLHWIIIYILNNIHWIIIVIAFLFFSMKLIKRNRRLKKSKKVAKIVRATQNTTATPQNGNTTTTQNTPATPPKKEKFWDGFGKIMAVISVVGTILLIVWLIISIYSIFSSKEKKRDDIYQTETSYSFPTSGKGIATQKNPIKAYLDPSKTYTWSEDKLGFKIVFEKNPEIQLIITENPDNQEQQKKWSNMPPGNYLVYPLKDISIRFEWWQ